MRFYFLFFFIYLTFPLSLYALNLQEYLLEVLENHPKVQESYKKLQEYNLETEKISTEYLPKVDILSSVGAAKSGHIKDSIEKQDYHFYSNTLRIKQNLFNGFSTTNRYDYSNYKALSYFYAYKETLNDIAFEATQAYINYIKSYRLLQVAQEAVNINEKILSDVKEIYKVGMISYSEVTKTESSLALSKANLIIEKNNIQNKLSILKEFLGRELSISEISTPSIDIIMPESLQRTTMLAIDKNPTIKVQENEIQSAKQLYEVSKSNYYPIVDATFEQYFNDRDEQLIYDLPDDRSKIFLNAKWNLYNGGADEIEIKKSIISISENISKKRTYIRGLIRQVEQAWNQYHTTKEQLEHLYILKKYSQETLYNNAVEYKIGSKTLIDLLFAQTDLIRAQREIVQSQSMRLEAQYKILYTMGLAAESILDTKSLADEFENQTTLLNSNDYDQDGITDNLDLCQNSNLKDNIKPDGCFSSKKDDDFDGISNQEDLCPDTKIGAKVDVNGCQENNQTSKLIASDLSYLNVPKAYDETSPVKKQEDGLYDYLYSLEITKNTPSREYEKELMYKDFQLIKRFEPIFMNKKLDEKTLQKISSVYKKHNSKNLLLSVIGHTQSIEDTNMKELSQNFAQKVASKLISLGLPADIMVIEGRSNLDKLYYETHSNYAQKNNRVMVTLYNKKEKSTNDDDKDGISNNIDECQNTPMGYIVDEVGCDVLINLKVLFENDSADINIKKNDTIKEFSKFLLAHPSYNTHIIGHTSVSRKETPQYNMQLSIKRANNVKKLLIKLGIDESRIIAEGRGQTEPIASNETRLGQAKNRRIEANLIKKESN